jgi:hypothetical protein
LSPYWQRPREIWARLFEQYIWTKRGRQEGVAAGGQYTELLAYWPERDWAQLEPLVEAEIKRRLALIREAVTWSLPIGR